MEELNKVFENIDIDNYQFYGHKDARVRIILQAWANHFNKAYPRGLCSREFESRMKQIYNVWLLEKKGKKDPVTEFVQPKKKRNNKKKGKK